MKQYTPVRSPYLSDKACSVRHYDDVGKWKKRSVKREVFFFKKNMSSIAASIQLNRRVLNAGTPSELVGVVEGEGASFNAVNVATALHRLAIRFRAATKVVLSGSKR